MRLTYLVFAVIISIGVFFGVYSMLGKTEEPQQIVQEPQVIVQEVKTRDVYVALKPIAVGDVLDQTKMDRQPWPEHLIGESFVIASGKNATQVVGMVARAPFQAGEVIMLNKLANPEDPSFLAAQLPEGMRAVTISTDPIAGLAGFIYPGDRVDVLFTHSLLSKEEQRLVDMRDKEEEGNPRRVQEKRLTEMLIADVRVLAVNQKAVLTGKEDARDLLPASITLEVEQKDAQRLRLAEREGELSLVLRSLHDDAIQYVRPSAEADLTRTLPPGFFEELYGPEEFQEQLQPEQMKQEIKKKKNNRKVIVVRGVEVEEIEFETVK